MTALATQRHGNGNGNGNGGGGGTALATPGSPNYSIDDIWKMAVDVAEAKIFKGFDTPQKVFALMMLCDADGLHPMQAVRMYDFIDGKPAMKASVIQALFIQRGGKIEIVRCDHKEARAIFSHPTLQPKPIELAYTEEDVKLAGLAGKDNHKQNGQDMKWWRLMSKSINKIDPGIRSGISSSIEAADDAYLESLPSVSVRAQIEQAEAELSRPAITSSEEPLAGYTGTGPDSRIYNRVAEDLIKHENDVHAARWEPLVQQGSVMPPLLDLKGLYAHMIGMAVNLGYCERPGQKQSQVVGALNQVYVAHRAWMRDETKKWVVSQEDPIVLAWEAETERLAAEQAQDAAEEGEAIYQEDVNFKKLSPKPVGDEVQAAGDREA